MMVYIIVELSTNHKGSLQNILDTIKAAREIGVNCIKLQAYTTDKPKEMIKKAKN